MQLVGLSNIEELKLLQKTSNKHFNDVSEYSAYGKKIQGKREGSPSAVYGQSISPTFTLENSIEENQRPYLK